MTAAGRGVLLALLVWPLTASAFTADTRVESFHRREVSGWTLLAIEVAIPEYTACILGGPEPTLASGEHATGLEVRAGSVAGVPVRRADGRNATTAVRAVLTESPAREAERGIDPLTRHLLEIAGCDPAEGARPILLLAGPVDAGTMMEVLLEWIPRLRVGPSALRERPRAAWDRWWRHVELVEGDRVGVGFVVDSPSAPEQLATRLAWDLLTDRLEGDGGRPEIVPWTAKRLFVRWYDRPASEAPRLGERVRAALRELATSPPDSAEVAEVRARLLRLDQEHVTEPDRWFRDILLDELAGERPRPVDDLLPDWAAIDLPFLQRVAIEVLPRDVLTVSAGAYPGGGGGSGATGFGPTERWPSIEPALDALDPEERRTLVASVLARSRRSVLGKSDAIGFEVHGRWEFLAAAVVEGTVHDRLDLPDRIQRTFEPEGSGLEFRLQVPAPSRDGSDSEGPEWSGPGADAARQRTRSRLRSDPWNVLWGFELHRSEASREGGVSYLGGIIHEGVVFQGLRRVESGDTLDVWIDPVSGEPRRFWIDDRRSVRPHEVRYLGYQDFAGGRYPTRIEWWRAARREEAIDVGRVIRDEVANPDPLQ